MDRRTFITTAAVAPLATKAIAAAPDWKAALARCEALVAEINAQKDDDVIEALAEELSDADNALADVLEDADAIPKPVARYFAENELWPSNSAMADRMLGL